MTPLDAPVNHCMSAIEEHGGVHTSGGDFDGFEGLLADGVIGETQSTDKRDVELFHGVTDRVRWHVAVAVIVRRRHRHYAIPLQIQTFPG